MASRRAPPPDNVFPRPGGRYGHGTPVEINGGPYKKRPWRGSFPCDGASIIGSDGQEFQSVRERADRGLVGRGGGVAPGSRRANGKWVGKTASRRGLHERASNGEKMDWFSGGKTFLSAFGPDYIGVFCYKTQYWTFARRG